MNCTHSFYVQDKNTKKFNKVPCGKCIACRVNRRNDWTNRILDELNYWKDSCFTTMTYNEQNLPQNGSIQKDSMSKFVRAIRKVIAPHKISYYGAAEYGENYDRPHYHMILFGLPATQATRALLDRSWNKGFVHVGKVSHASARYVAKYCVKYDTRELKEGQLAPFSRMSLKPAIGLRYVLDHKEELRKNGGTLVRGIVKPYETQAPRMYKKKIFTDVERLCINKFRQRQRTEKFALHYGVDYVSDAMLDEDYQIKADAETGNVLWWHENKKYYKGGKLKNERTTKVI